MLVGSMKGRKNVADLRIRSTKPERFGVWLRVSATGVCLLVFAAGAVDAVSDTRTTARGLSFGYDLHRFHDDFGVGLTITSPYFAAGRLAVQLCGTASWLEGTPAHRSNETWLPYANARLNIVGVGATIAEAIRLYGKAGLVVVVPNEDFSSSAHVGGNGVFGFEFIPNTVRSPVSYYAELGAVGTGARADRLPAKPFYANGFLVSVGLRHYVR